MACPVCSCERIQADGMGVNCICTRCTAEFPVQRGAAAWLELAAPLTGAPDELELGDVIEYEENPDARPFWIWDR